MGWSKRTEVDLREEFVLKALAQQMPFNRLCEAYGVSRTTGYKWVKRYKARGVEGLVNQSTAPHSSPHRTDDAIAKQLIAMRERWPTWGALKIRQRLQTTHPDVDWPAVSTIHGIFDRAGLVQARTAKRERKHQSKPLIDTEVPNTVWCTDYKGEFKTQDGRYCYPLTCINWASRYALGCDANASVAHAATRPSFERLFDTFGVPDAILSDNGVPFAHPSSTCRLSRLNVWWIKLGIRLIRSVPGHPEHNPRIERFHRTLKEETTRPPATNMEGQQDLFDQFLDEYNTVRPHQALDGQTPATHYKRSEREPKVRDSQYPGHFEVRRVGKMGQIKLKKARYFVTQTLATEDVGLEEVDDGVWDLYFQDHYIGVINDKTGQMTEIGPTPVPVNVLTMYSKEM